MSVMSSLALQGEPWDAPGRVDRAVEARKARRRLYPVSMVYSTYSSFLLAVALARTDRLVSVAFFLLGGAAWTALEYHSVHFCSFRARYFQYIKRHHLYHHSPIGTHVGYGLTSGAWDVVFATRIPELARKALYSAMR